MSQSLSYETALPLQLIALECSRGNGSPSSRCQWVLEMHLSWTSVLCPVRALRQMVPVRGGHTINATFTTGMAQMEPACCGVAGKLALGLESEPMSSFLHLCAGCLWSLTASGQRHTDRQVLGTTLAVLSPRKQGHFPPHPSSSGKAFSQFPLCVTWIFLPHQLQVSPLPSRASRCFSVNRLASNQTLTKVWFKGVVWVTRGNVRPSQTGFSSRVWGVEQL